MKHTIYVLGALTIVGSSCINQKQSDSQVAEMKATAYPAIDTASFDKTVNPAEDFFRYVNGNWVKNNPIPATEASWSNFNDINERNQKSLRELLDGITSTEQEKGSIKQKLADFYKTVIDTVELDKQGFKPLEGELQKVDAIKNMDDLTIVLADLCMKGLNPFFSLGITVDQKNSSRYITSVYQGGLGLPDRDYYFEQNEKFENIRNEYKKYIQNLFQLVNVPAADAQKNSTTVFNIESDIAKKCRSRVKLRDAEANYNLKKLDEVKAMFSALNWDTYLKNQGLQVSEMVVGQPEFVENVNSIMKNTSLEDLKVYVKWNVVRNASSKLSAAFVDETFRFYGTVLNGIKNQKPRWKVAVEAVDNSIGEGLGQLYVEKYFSPESKQKVNEMIENLTLTYKDRIANLPWMGSATKEQALTKLSTIIRKIGYPDKWKDYSSMEITRESYLKNSYAANIFASNYVIARINKPVDKTEWQMTPATVNAYYDPTINEIVFPAGIMQPPFFNPDADDAVNYGAMGAIIGHELTHGFDDEGSHYDYQGNLKEWWTPEDRNKFNERTNIIVQQFNGYSPIDTMHVNGMLTLGENIADLGGLTLSYYAFKRSLQGKPAPEKIDGYTAEQRFFISWAQGWRNNMRDEALRNMIVTNPHSPAQYRVNGPLANMKEFYDAFGVKEGDKLYKPETARAIIW